MKLKLTVCKTERAIEDFACEASEIYWKIPRPIKYKHLEPKDMVFLFKARIGKVYADQRYLYMEFWDSDTGEELIFRCISEMNKLMFRQELYPTPVMQAMRDYKQSKTSYSDINSSNLFTTSERDGFVKIS